MPCFKFRPKLKLFNSRNSSNIQVVEEEEILWLYFVQKIFHYNSRPLVNENSPNPITMTWASNRLPAACIHFS